MRGLPSGRDSADRIATAWFAAFASTPIGRRRRRCRCGGGRSGPAGRRSRSAAICSIRRSSAATRRSSRVIACRRASRCGVTPIRFVSTNRTAAPARAARRRSTRIASTRWARPDVLNALDAQDRQEDLVAQHVDRYVARSSVLGHLELAADRRRCGDRQRGRHARRDTTLATGKQRWIGPLHGGSYSSPHLVTIDGVTQVVILSSPGAVSVNPADGKLLWDYKWEGGAIIQPAVTEDGDILINAMSATGGSGTKRLAIKHDGATLDAGRALDDERAEAVFQRLRDSQGPRLRLRQQHPRVHRSRRWQAQVEGRTLTATASWCCLPIRICCS